MPAISSFERASVERRINAIKESFYNLPLKEMPPTLRAYQMRLLLSELRQLAAIIDPPLATPGRRFRSSRSTRPIHRPARKAAS